MTSQRTKDRSRITLDLPPQQVFWLDQQADRFLLSRSAFVRRLIAHVMESQEQE